MWKTYSLMTAVSAVQLISGYRFHIHNHKKNWWPGHCRRQKTCDQKRLFVLKWPVQEKKIKLPEWSDCPYTTRLDHLSSGNSFGLAFKHTIMTSPFKQTCPSVVRIGMLQRGHDIPYLLVHDSMHSFCCKSQGYNEAKNDWQSVATQEEKEDSLYVLCSYRNSMK